MLEVGIEGLKLGLTEMADPMVILMIVFGSFMGTLIGALPGLGPASGCSLLLPIAVKMASPQQGMALLCSIYLGCMFGGRITAILINVPGDGAAVCTTFDGYPMMQKGRGGVALGISALSSCFGGAVSFLALSFLAPALAKVALNFGSPEYFSVMVFGFAAIIGMAEGQYIRSIVSLGIGILISTVGLDTLTGTPRYVFTPSMFEGINFAVCALGLFGLCEVLRTAETNAQYKNLGEAGKKITLKTTLPSLAEIKSVIIPTIRSTLIGGFVGFLPGAGGTIATFVTYSTEKNLSKHPEEFGQGCLEGVAAPEAANNASVGGAMIPMLSLGIPGSSTTAVMLGALTMFGLQAGPRVFEKSGDVVWAMIAALWIANIILVALNIFMIPAFIKMIDVGQRYLKPIICATVFIGVFAITYGTFALYVTVLCSLLGFFLKKFDYPVAPLLLCLVLFDSVETNFRQSMLISRGSYAVFFTRPISLIFIILSVAWLCIPLFKKLVAQAKAKKAGTAKEV